MSSKSGQVVVGGVLLVIGVLVIANPGFMDLRETLFDKPLAVALPATVLIAAGFLIGATQRRSVILLVAVAGATALGTVLWLFAPPAFEFAEGGVQTLPEALIVGLLIGLVTACAVAIGMGLRTIAHRARKPVGSVRA